MKIGEIFRYSRPYKADVGVIDGLPNYFFATRLEGSTLPLLESGINPIKSIEAVDGLRCPAVLISSSPHKIGSRDTPWQDSFDPDNGHIRYYGDNKISGVDPSTARGNKILLREFNCHSSSRHCDRVNAVPILFFKRVQVGDRSKGNVEFQGFGVISRIERITQRRRANDKPFANYVFDFVVFDQSAEDEEFDWRWINARRNPGKSVEETSRLAPESWKIWTRKGAGALSRCRRRVVRLLTYPSSQQQCAQNSRERVTLDAIYSFYSQKKARFDALAAFVTERVINQSHSAYRLGWITPSSSDGGADFVGRIDIGTDLAKVKIIVLGQAKCEKPDTPTNGNHIARTVARLRRGWIGAYVTTSYFSDSVQREVLEDRYPIILINGSRVAREVLDTMHERGLSNVKDLLETVDGIYDKLIQDRAPEQLLFE